jgi:hypothetical protein
VNDQGDDPRLAVYLRLEEATAMLDALGDGALADRVRDLMDPLWWSLADAARDALNARGTIGDDGRELARADARR